MGERRCYVTYRRRPALLVLDLPLQQGQGALGDGDDGEEVDLHDGAEVRDGHPVQHPAEAHACARACVR